MDRVENEGCFAVVRYLTKAGASLKKMRKSAKSNVGKLSFTFEVESN